MRGLIAGLTAQEVPCLGPLSGGCPDEIARLIRQQVDNSSCCRATCRPRGKPSCSKGWTCCCYTDIGMDPVTYSLAFSRLAPVQCVTWGHPVTTGIETIDYFLSSESSRTPVPTSTTPERWSGSRACRFTATARCCPAPARAGRTLACRRSLLYGCPQSLFKFHPDFDALLGSILRRDPHGILVLHRVERAWFGPWVEFLRRRFAARFPMSSTVSASSRG